MSKSKYPHVDYSALPAHLEGGARRYIEDGVEPGSFLTAVLCNDLREACGRADSTSRANLFEIVSWFYIEAPSQCWGSIEKMDAWIEARAADREAA